MRQKVPQELTAFNPEKLREDALVALKEAFGEDVAEGELDGAYEKLDELFSKKLMHGINMDVKVGPNGVWYAGTSRGFKVPLAAVEEAYSSALDVLKDVLQKRASEKRPKAAEVVRQARLPLGNRVYEFSKPPAELGLIAARLTIQRLAQHVGLTEKDATAEMVAEEAAVSMSNLEFFFLRAFEDEGAFVEAAQAYVGLVSQVFPWAQLKK